MRGKKNRLRSKTPEFPDPREIPWRKKSPFGSRKILRAHDTPIVVIPQPPIKPQDKSKPQTKTKPHRVQIIIRPVSPIDFPTHASHYYIPRHLSHHSRPSALLDRDGHIGSRKTIIPHPTHFPGSHETTPKINQVRPAHPLGVIMTKRERRKTIRSHKTKKLI